MQLLRAELMPVTRAQAVKVMTEVVTVGRLGMMLTDHAKFLLRGPA